MAAPFHPDRCVRSVDPLPSPADLKRFDPLLPQQEAQSVRMGLAFAIAGAVFQFVNTRKLAK